MRVPRVGEEFGPYRIDAHLGMGGMGVVLRATDTRLGRTIALKVVSGRLAGSEEFRQRFHREADVLARLDSPHIIAIYDHAERDGCPYIATQYVAGGDLDDLLRDRGGLAPRAAAALCSQVAEALQDAHRAGVVHRDVKPSNVLLRDPLAETPHAYLCDFGIAQTDSPGDQLTMTGAVAGSWAYLAPERARGGAGSPASDIYALGCLLWATLTGQPPYAGSDAQIAIAHVQAPIPQLPGNDQTDRDLNAALRRALAKSPADRYADADGMRRDLVDIGRGAAPSVAARRPSRGRRARWLATGMAACLVVAGGVAWRWWPSDDPPAAARNEPPRTASSSESSEPADDRPVTGDHDGDGYGDLLFENYRRGKTLDRVVVSSTGRRLAQTSSTPWTKQAPTYEVAGDFDGDSRVERLVMSLSETHQTLTITPLDAGGAAKTLSRKRPVRDLCGSFFAGDFNGDGDLDLGLILGPEKGNRGVWVLPGSGTGTDFGRPRRWLANARIPCGTSYLPGDFDGDGRADLALADIYAQPPGTIPLRLLRSTGTRFELGAVTRVPDDGYGGTVVLAGDFDGDAKTELALYTSGQTARDIRVIGSRGTRFTQGKTWVVQPGQSPDYWDYSELTVSDVNGDHRDDVIRIGPVTTGRRRTYPFYVFASNGSAFAQPKVWGRLGCRSACDDARNTSPIQAW